MFLDSFGHVLGRFLASFGEVLDVSEEVMNLWGGFWKERDSQKYVICFGKEKHQK